LARRIDVIDLRSFAALRMTSVTAYLVLNFWRFLGTWMLEFSDSSDFGFTRAEFRKLRALKNPVGVQKFLDDLPYNLSFTAASPKRVLHDRTASCLEGGIFAAAALRILGFPPLIFDLEAEQDTDHVVAIFKVRGHWGAVAKSNF